MTVAVAVRKNDRIILAADTLLTFSGDRVPADNCKVEKIYRVGSSVLAWAGWSLYAELLDAYLTSNPPPTLNNEVHIFTFFVKFWRSMRDDYTFMYNRATAESHPFVNLDSTFLVVNAAGIFKVSGDMDVTRFEQYCAIGSGAKYAMGALRVLYDKEVDAEAIARRAVQVGIDFNAYCGGSIDSIEIGHEDGRRHLGPRRDVIREETTAVAAEVNGDQATTANPRPKASAERRVAANGAGREQKSDGQVNRPGRSRP